MNVFAFDIETVPDVAGARRIHGLGDTVTDAGVAEALFAMRRRRTGSDFLPLHLHRVVAIAAVYRAGERLSVWSLGDEDASEADLIRRFFHGIDRYSPDLVSWNGSGFDLPVLHHRALVHGITAPRYWETGDEEQSFRWNNYISRYHARHTDLMDVLAGYQPRASAPLDEMAVLCGFPGKLGMSGSRVWEAWLNGERANIRAYCETDAMNTYLLWLRYQHLRGRLDETGLSGEVARVRDTLAADASPHWQAFMEAWDVPPEPTTD